MLICIVESDGKGKRLQPCRFCCLLSLLAVSVYVAVTPARQQSALRKTGAHTRISRRWRCEGPRRKKALNLWGGGVNFGDWDQKPNSTPPPNHTHPTPTLPLLLGTEAGAVRIPNRPFFYSLPVIIVESVYSPWYVFVQCACVYCCGNFPVFYIFFIWTGLSVHLKCVPLVCLFFTILFFSLFLCFSLLFLVHDAGFMVRASTKSDGRENKRYLGSNYQCS